MKKAAPKKAPAKEKAAPRKRASKKKQDDDESGEDFGAELDAVSGDDEEEEVPKPKRKVRSCPSCNILFLTTITARLKAVFQKDFF